MVIGVIPARFASTRFMGKPLADIGGKPMIQHTYESASKSKLISKIVIAVDDKKVGKVAEGFGAEVIMTPKSIATGSDRIALVAKYLQRRRNNCEYSGRRAFYQRNNDRPGN